MRLVALFALLVFTHLCLGGVAAAQEKPVTLGALYGLTGDWSPHGVPSSRGALLFERHVNEAGGVLERPLKLIVKDTTGTIAGATSLAEAILAEDPDVSALFGLSDSDPVRAAAKVAAAQGRVFVTSGATSPQLPKQVPIYLFLAAFGDNVQAAAGAEFAQGNLDARSASIFYDDSHTYTRLLHGYFKQSFEARGGQVKSVVRFDGADNFADAADQLADADIIYLAAETPPEAVAFARILRTKGFNQPIVGGDGFDGETAWQAYPSLKDIYFTTHAYFGGGNPSALVEKFRNDYMEAYDGQVPNAFAGLGYDTAGLLAAAIEKAGSVEPEQVLQALSTIEGYEGVTGTISFIDGSHVPLKSVTILQVADGKRNFVEQIIPTDIPGP